ncbi:hypothetical protein H5410_050478 [Solanum commersonii]|uniref:Uncharacterized protein n=1 Tax=Solanum commersonii TaxID=4109 RepID=A0A9J5WVK4_SOLCO|nr:hypothetical protein H5410_050478 [Solanum commersonii]
MGESKILNSVEIPRQPRQELNAKAIADTIAEAEAAIAQAEAIITEIQRVVSMVEEILHRYHHVKPVIKLLFVASLGHQILSWKSLLLTVLAAFELIKRV